MQKIKKNKTFFQTPPITAVLISFYGHKTRRRTTQTRTSADFKTSGGTTAV